jgi:hypothetical protein
MSAFVITTFTAFGLIALAELGDKTQLVCMTLAARHPPAPVLIGAVLAFAVLNLLAVLFGASVAAWAPEWVTAAVVAVLFAVFGWRAWREADAEIVEVEEKSGSKCVVCLPSRSFSWRNWATKPNSPWPASPALRPRCRSGSAGRWDWRRLRRWGYWPDAPCCDDCRCVCCTGQRRPVPAAGGDRRLAGLRYAVRLNGDDRACLYPYRRAAIHRRIIPGTGVLQCAGLLWHLGTVPDLFQAAWAGPCPGSAGAPHCMVVGRIAGADSGAGSSGRLSGRIPQRAPSALLPADHPADFRNWLLYIWAVQTGRILEASLGYYINPLVNVVLGVLFLRERLNPRQWSAVAIAASAYWRWSSAMARFPGFP